MRQGHFRFTALESSPWPRHYRLRAAGADQQEAHPCLMLLLPFRGLPGASLGPGRKGHRCPDFKIRGDWSAPRPLQAVHSGTCGVETNAQSG